jgi:Domain of unknown function (DUF5666)
MNTGPADIHSPHLDLEDLIAQVNGRPVADQARDHLARCEHCRAEASRWNLVAGGVRALAAITPEMVPPAQPSPVRPHGPGRPGRRAALLASAAAGLVVLGGLGYGATAVLGRHSPEPVLTAVTGCSGFKVAAGTLQQVNGSSFVIKTAGGQRVTVTTTGSTTVSVAGPLLSDITNGKQVIVLGHSSGGSVTAASVTVTSSLRRLTVSPPQGWVVVRGTVADATAGGFTVVTSGGTSVPVITTASTFVVDRNASVSQLKTGVSVVAAGHAGSDRTLSAAGVLQQRIVPQPSGGQFQVHLNMRARGCSPAALAVAVAKVLPSAG